MSDELGRTPGKPSEFRADRKGRAARPRDAATLVLVRRDGPAPTILMGRRAAGHAFMPDKYVFPGGKVDRTDRTVPAATEPDADTCAAIGGRRAARAVALACVREMYEETGLAIGVPGHARYHGSDAGWAGYFSTGLVPDLAALGLFARAITPPHRVKRFDARFFMADAARVLPEGQTPRDGAEMEDLRWFTIEEAYGLDLPNVTRFVIGEVAARLAAPDQPHRPAFLRWGPKGHQLDRL
jgi:8-oxo-dGTP pyrophosphatase MutT (NUDIX family)